MDGPILFSKKPLEKATRSDFKFFLPFLRNSEKSGVSLSTGWFNTLLSDITHLFYFYSSLLELVFLEGDGFFCPILDRI
jgi:hypothetical protein